LSEKGWERRDANKEGNDVKIKNRRCEVGGLEVVGNATVVRRSAPMLVEDTIVTRLGMYAEQAVCMRDEEV
jgi:hypothetical protein